MANGRQIDFVCACTGISQLVRPLCSGSTACGALIWPAHATRALLMLIGRHLTWRLLACGLLFIHGPPIHWRPRSAHDVLKVGVAKGARNHEQPLIMQNKVSAQVRVIAKRWHKHAVVTCFCLSNLIIGLKFAPPSARLQIRGLNLGRLIKQTQNYLSI